MRTTMPFTFALWLWASLVQAGAPKATQVLEIKSAKHVEAVLTYLAKYPNLKAKEWVVFAPQAPELPGQINVKSRLEPAGQVIKESSPLRRPVFMARLPVQGGPLEAEIPIKMVYEATLRSRNLRVLGTDEKAAKAPAPAATTLKAALAEQGDVNFSSPAFKKWLKAEKLQRREGESDLDFARRVYLAIRGHFTYHYEGTMDRSASAVCQAGKADCGGLICLFTAALRSQGVPARMLYGRWATSAEARAKLGGIDYYQWHVKGEFFAQGVGWVPVDLSSGILHDKSKAGLAYFGRDSGDFFTMHLDTDLEVDTIHFGKQKLHNLQTPMFWATGEGNLKAGKIQQNWQVRQVK